MMLCIRILSIVQIIYWLKSTFHIALITNFTLGEFLWGWLQKVQLVGTSLVHQTTQSMVSSPTNEMQAICYNLSSAKIFSVQFYRPTNAIHVFGIKLFLSPYSLWLQKAYCFCFMFYFLIFPILSCLWKNRMFIVSLCYHVQQQHSCTQN